MSKILPGSEWVRVRPGADLEAYRKRLGLKIARVPHITLRLEDGELWVKAQKTHNLGLGFMRSLKKSEDFFSKALLLVELCCELVSVYGYFGFKESLVCLNSKHQLCLWINSDPLLNYPSIVLPCSTSGQRTMLAGLIAFFDKCGHQNSFLWEGLTRLEDLLERFCALSREAKVADYPDLSLTRLAYDSSHSPNALSQRDNYSSSMDFKAFLTNSHKTVVDHRSNSVFTFHDNQKKFRSYARYQDSKIMCQTTTVPASNESPDETLIPDPPAPTGRPNYFPYNTTSKLKVLKEKIDAEVEKQKTVPDEPQPLKSSLGRIGEELDNLFQSMIESSSEDAEQAKQREREFEQVLDL